MRDRKRAQERAALQTTPWHIVKHLTNQEQMAAYLEAALEEGDPAVVRVVLEDIAQSGGFLPQGSTQ